MDQDFAKTLDEHFLLVSQNLRRTTARSKVDIATYGLAEGQRIGAILAYLNSNIPTRLLVGVGNRDSDGEKLMDRLYSASLMYPKVQLRTAQDSHLKLFLFHRFPVSESTAIVGGRNLVNADWSDVSIELDSLRQIRQLRDYFNEVWERAQPYKEPKNFITELNLPD